VKRVREFDLRVGDSIVWPDGAIVIVEVVDPELFRTRDLATMRLDWLQQQDFLEGGYEIFRAK